MNISFFAATETPGSQERESVEISTRSAESRERIGQKGGAKEQPVRGTHTFTHRHSSSGAGEVQLLPTAASSVCGVQHLYV